MTNIWIRPKDQVVSSGKVSLVATRLREGLSPARAGGVVDLSGQIRHNVLTGCTVWGSIVLLEAESGLVTEIGMGASRSMQ